MSSVPNWDDPDYSSALSQFGYDECNRLFSQLPSSPPSGVTPDYILDQFFQFEKAIETWVPWKKYLRHYGEIV